MTQMRDAKEGRITDAMKKVAEAENIRVEKLRMLVASGEAVIIGNTARKTEPLGVGRGLRVKVNANIGTSPDYTDMEEEVEKAKTAMKYGADTIMDLSTGGDISRMRRELLKKIPLPLGTVPIYQAGVESIGKNGSIVDMDVDTLFNTIEEQAREGVDFMTVHAGMTMESLEKYMSQRRLAGMVSRGGCFLAAWMLHNKKENPLYSDYDYLLEVAGEYDVTLSLGDALRPGSIKDSTDSAQVQELIILGELVDRARKSGVQCIVEGPGHIPLNEIEANVILQKKLCRGAPFYVLGPLVTDIAPGYDHITGAIGGAVAAFFGADFLCYVTPSEHLALPNVEDVRKGVVASKIAAHAADLARGIDVERDNAMARARANLNWSGQFKLCIDAQKAMEYRKERKPATSEVCTMCGNYCAIKLAKQFEKSTPEK